MVEVDALPEAVAKATENGTTVIAENLQGPAAFISDPGGATTALWKRADGV